jgi:pimeloyl-ACP methyl ester carboxylesterase
MNTYQRPIIRTVRLPSLARIARAIGIVLLRVLTALLILLMAVPVLLLPVSTAVPAPIWIVLAGGDLALIIALLRFARTWSAATAMLIGFVVVAGLAVAASQSFAATPPILGTNGQPLPGSIATMEKVTLNGSEQWITMRGKNVNNPVLLYLGIGGPGAGGFPATFTSLAPLEDHFVVVNWDQPGTGKSYSARPISSLTVQQVVDDAHALTELLRARFHQDKIYVIGLSWGTIVGTTLVQQHPDLFYAYMGMGQMVNTTENDRMGYELALKLVTERGDTRTANRLRANGPPPYAGNGMAMKYAVYNNVLFDYMGNARLEIILLLVPQLAREYGLWDRVNFDRGLIESFAVLYPQLRDLDFTTQANTVDVPMFFLHGRNDVNAVSSLVERYYNGLHAPHKELIWLESGHGAGPEEIRDALVNRVLVQAPPVK